MSTIDRTRPLPQPPLRQRLHAFRQRWIRPVWCIRVASRFIAKLIDIQDVIYVSAIAMVAFGAERIWGSGFGLFCAGLLLLVPIHIAFFKKGPQQ